MNVTKSAKITERTVTAPKLLVMGNDEVARAEKPNTVVRPEAAMAAPIRLVAIRSASMELSVFSFSS